MSPSVPVGLRERRKESTRRALVEAALRLFADRGYHAVTVEDICAEVEVSPRTFFRYFTVKEQVLAEPITAVLDAVRETLAAQPSGGAVWPQLRTAVLSALAMIEARREDFLRTGTIVKASPETLSSSSRALMEWELTVKAEVTQRLGDGADDLRPRLLLGTAMLAFRAALDVWAESGGAQPLLPLAEQALDAVEPGAKAVERA